jgi:hypothetical protein
VGRARGKVLEVTVSAGNEAEVAAAMEVVARSSSDGRVTLRGVAGPGGPPSGARLADDPTLEEAYLAFMADRGRAVAALAEEVAS